MAFLKSPWKSNLPWKVLENKICLESAGKLFEKYSTFTIFCKTYLINGNQDQDKIVVSLFGIA